MDRPRLPALLALVLTAALVGWPRPAAPPDRPDGTTPDAPKTPAPATPRPGDRVAWVPFAPLRAPGYDRPGILRDADAHLPPSAGQQYRSADLGNWCHEATHGVHAHLRNTHGRPGFYVGGDRAALVPRHPPVTITELARRVPAGLRNYQYQTYMVSQARQWDREPLYLWDEWAAYVNGARCERELARPGGGRAATLADYLPVALALVLGPGLDPEAAEVLALLLRLTAEYADRSGETLARLKGPDGGPYREGLARLYGAALTLEGLFP